MLHTIINNLTKYSKKNRFSEAPDIFLFTEWFFTRTSETVNKLIVQSRLKKRVARPPIIFYGGRVTGGAATVKFRVVVPPVAQPPIILRKIHGGVYTLTNNI